jgi:predicted ArsR family transcriptional regulator
MVAREHVDLVCGMNLALMGGLVAALDRDDVEVQLDPAADRCCIAFAATG